MIAAKNPSIENEKTAMRFEISIRDVNSANVYSSVLKWLYIRYTAMPGIHAMEISNASNFIFCVFFI